MGFVTYRLEILHEVYSSVDSRTFYRVITMYSNFKDKAIESVTQAVQADKDGQYEDALELYKRALELFRVRIDYILATANCLLRLHIQ